MGFFFFFFFFHLFVFSWLFSNAPWCNVFLHHLEQTKFKSMTQRYEPWHGWNHEHFIPSKFIYFGKVTMSITLSRVSPPNYVAQLIADHIKDKVIWIQFWNFFYLWGKRLVRSTMNIHIPTGRTWININSLNFLLYPNPQKRSCFIIHIWFKLRPLGFYELNHDWNEYVMFWDHKKRPWFFKIMPYVRGGHKIPSHVYKVYM